MKVSYVEGLANHNGPESCGAAREGGVEALTGGRTGRVLSREMYARLLSDRACSEVNSLSSDGSQPGYITNCLDCSAF
jgi:hypothetical protein